jgi:ABC-type transporter MlaC component
MEAHERRRHRVELLATILLAVAAVATAWSTYQSTQWRGQQAADNSKAPAARIQSSQASTRAGQLTQVDIATFTQWVDAYVAGNTALADFYRKRLRPEFQPAFEAWLATDPLTNANAPATPFAMRNTE